MSELSDRLENILNNISGFYDNDWRKHSEIKDYISIYDMDIKNVDEMIYKGR